MAYQNWAEAGIAMLGPTESGKSTFLCALRKALLDHEEEWLLFTRDEVSQRMLDDMSGALLSEGALPMATQSIDTIRWILSGTVPRTERKGRFGVETTVRDHVEITLRLTDASGELGRSDRIGLTDRNDLIKELSDSRGILYMFDPIREFTHGDTFQITDSLLGELLGKVSSEPGFDGRLPHYLAVCVTKLDDPRVFQTAMDLGLLLPDQSSEWGFPQPVDEADAQRLFQALGRISRTGNGDAVPRMLERLFHPERINYYVTSAVGFMINQRTRVFNPHDTQNVYNTASGAPLVRGPVHPVNVVEPVLWLARQLSEDARKEQQAQALRQAQPSRQAQGTQSTHTRSFKDDTL